MRGSRAQIIERVCDNCEITFKYKDTKRNRNRKYCGGTCAKSANGKRNKGRKHTEKTKQYLSKINSGKNNAFYGKSHTEETKKLLGEKSKERWRDKNSAFNTEEYREKHRQNGLGENNPFYDRKHSKESRALISKNHADHKREKNPNWNSDKTDEERKHTRKYGDYNKFVIECLKRDDYTCQITKQRGVKLVVHHLKSYAKYPEFRTDIDNGITITKEKHNEFHSKYGIKNFTEKDFREFVKYV